MKRRWSYRIGLFLLMLGIFTGCEALPEVLDTLEQGIVQGEHDGAEGSDEKNDSKEKENPPEKDSSEEEGDLAGIDGSVGEGNPAGKEDPEEGSVELPEEKIEKDVPDEDGEYTSKEEVAAYLHEYGHLPDNFITKKEAGELGWVSSKGNLHEVAPGKSIGGDYFGNYEEILPKQSGRKYYECDIDTDGSYRGAKRIVYSSDGLIYYTEDHYTTFELLYTKDGPAEE